MGRRLGLALVVLAAAAGGVAVALLRSAQEAVDRVVVPVDVAAPDLYPPDTLLFAAVHGIDEAHAAAERAWRRFEGTAMHSLAERAWRERVLPESAPLRASVDEFQRSMDAAERRLGYRPTGADFFRVYGRHTAFGLVPSGTEGARPSMLAVVRLPDEGAQALLEQTLGGGAGGAVVRHAPPDLRGYPVFTEQPGFLDRLYYGIGGGFLFVSDALPALDAALARLDFRRHPPAEGAAPGTDPAEPSLSGDPGFRAVAGSAWDRVVLALHVRRDQQFARWHPSLSLVDDALRGAFVLSPKDPSITIAALRPSSGADLELRSSFPVASPETAAWGRVLPAGLSQATLIRTVTAEEQRRAWGPAVERFRGKAIWREIDTLFRDTARLEGILGDALPPQRVPSRDTLTRLPRDLDLLAELFGSQIDAAVLGRMSASAFFAKVYGGTTAREQWAVAAGIDPLTLFFIAGAAEAAADRTDGAIVRDHAAGALCWRLDVGRALAAAGLPRRTADELLAAWGDIAPGMIAAGGRLYLCLGAEIQGELRSLASGGNAPPLDTDPLYTEAVAAVEPGAWRVAYVRPAEVARGYAGALRGFAESVASTSGLDEEGRDLMHALLAVVDRAVVWSQPVRAEVSWSLLDEARPAAAVTLLDPARREALGVGTERNARVEGLAALPPGTAFVSATRVPLRTVLEDLHDAFVAALPGGRERMDSLLDDVRAEEPGPLALRFVSAAIGSVDGECGVAGTAPPSLPVPQDGRLDLQGMLDRIPGATFWATYADAGEAFEAASAVLKWVAGQIEEVPFPRRHRDYARGLREYPVGAEFRRSMEKEFPQATLTLLLPEGRRGPIRTLALGVVRRGATVHYVFGEHLLRQVAGEGTGGLLDRWAREIPAGAIPAEVATLTAVRGSGIADCIHAYLEPLAPAGLALSLGAFREAPPPEAVVEAHVAGWRRVEALLDDLLRDSAWTVSWTVADGDRLRAETRRIPVPE